MSTKAEMIPCYEKSLLGDLRLVAKEAILTDPVAVLAVSSEGKRLK